MLQDEMRTELLRAALARKTITYGYLMNRFGLSRGSTGETVLGVLDAVDKAESLVGAPGFAAIVVRRDTGFPGGGFFCWEGIPESLRRPKERSTDPRLSQPEKDYIVKLQEKVWSYYHDHRGDEGVSLEQSRIDG
jgi:hypothetical protein